MLIYEIVEHLKALSRISKSFKNKFIRKTMKEESTSKNAIIKLITKEKFIDILKDLASVYTYY
ncbi:MAG: hypothetical protein LBM05_00130 [Endomicrobium sp.]|nr:hypothetical protein [Endomicrobium sp.]